MKRITLLLSMILMGSVLIQAQDDLPSSDIEVVKDFEARLDDSKRLDMSPSLPKVQKVDKNYTYNISSKQLQVDYDPPTLKPIGMGSEKNPESFNGYLKAGYGTQKQPYGELAYVAQLGKGSSKSRGGSRARPGSRSRGSARPRGTSSRSGRSSRSTTVSSPGSAQLGIHLKHHSAEGSDIENQRFSHTGGKLDFKTQTSQGFTIRAEAGYAQNDEFLYGYNQDSVSFTEDEARRRFQTLDLGLGIFNSVENSLGIDYSAEGKFYNHKDNLDNKEDAFIIAIGAGKWFNEQHKGGIDLVTDYSSYTLDCETCDFAPQELFNFSIKPYIDLHFGNVKLGIGANFATNDGAFDVFPAIEAALPVAGNRFVVFAGAKGGFEKNNFRTLTEYNPYVGIDSVFNTEVRDYYGGLKGNIKRFTYQGKVSYKQTKNLALYLNNENDGRFFRTITDDVDILSIGGNITFDVTDNVSILGGISQNIYTLETEEKAWHLPSFEANGGVQFTSPNQKVKVRGEIFVEDAVPYINNLGEVDNLNTLLDVNVNAEYSLTKNFGLFLDLNNLAGNERQRWNGYPQLSLNVVGGITAKF